MPVLGCLFENLLGATCRVLKPDDPSIGEREELTSAARPSTRLSSLRVGAHLAELRRLRVCALIATSGCASTTPATNPSVDGLGWRLPRSLRESLRHSRQGPHWGKLQKDYLPHTCGWCDRARPSDTSPVVTFSWVCISRGFEMLPRVTPQSGNRDCTSPQ